MSVSEFFLTPERCIFDGALRYALNHDMDLNWIRVTMKLPILDPECRSPIRTSLPMTFQGELGRSSSGHLSLWGTGRHFWKCGTPTVAVDENVSDCEVVSLPFTPHPLPILWQYAWTFAWPWAPGCISMPCAGYWLGQMLSSPHQPRLGACGSVWLFDVTCVSLPSFPFYFAVFHLICSSSNASDVVSGPAAVSCAWCFFASHLPCKTNWLLLWGGNSRAPGVFQKLVRVCTRMREYTCTKHVENI